MANAPELYGIGAFLQDLAKQEHSNGSQVKATLAFHVEGARSRAFSDLSIPIQYMGSARRPKLLLRCIKLFRRNDVVVLHTYSPFGFLAALYARKPVVFVFHGSFGICGRRYAPAVRLFYKSVVKRYTTQFVFASSAAQSRFEDLVGRLKAERVNVVPFGLDPDRVVSHLGREEMRKVLGIGGLFAIGAVARLDPVKRLDRLIDAVARIQGENDWRLLIIGDGRASYEAFIRDRIRISGLTDRVLLLGYRRDVIDIVNALDVFVLPSGFEGFGIALLEAMTLGIPGIVFSDGGGVVDILGDAGPVVCAPAALAQELDRFRFDPDSRRRTGIACKARAQRFLIAGTASHLYRVYCRAVGTDVAT